MADMNRRMAAPAATDPSVKRIAITGSAQSLDPSSRAVHITTAGNIVGKLLEESADVTETFEVGWHILAFKSVTSATAVGFFHC
jgi:hypothetical protein